MAEATTRSDDSDIEAISDCETLYTSTESDDCTSLCEEETVTAAAVTDRNHAVFLSVLEDLKEDCVFMASDGGPPVLEILERLKKNLSCMCTQELIAYLCVRVQSCIDKGNQCKRPSSISTQIWSAFHQLRLSLDLHQRWKSHLISKLNIDSEKVPMHSLQVLLDRLMKHLMRRESQEEWTPTDKVNQALIPEREMKVVHYMSGYVVSKMIKQYSKTSSDAAVHKKCKTFVSILKGMILDRSAVDLGTEEAMDARMEWTQLIDRGGLVHVKAEVLDLMKAVEYKVRQHLHTTSVQPGKDQQSAIIRDVVEDKSLVDEWDKITDQTTIQHKLHSLELLQEITRLWVTVRCHSFAKCYTMQQQQQFVRHGTRKMLKAKHTDKEAD